MSTVVHQSPSLRLSSGAEQDDRISTRCSTCSEPLRVRRVHLNKHIRCPRCGARTEVVADIYLDLDRPVMTRAGAKVRKPKQDGPLKRYAPVLGSALAILFAGLGIALGQVFFG
jgi:DNA-directed RNA polymerase subunit RPC12/RpoP